MSDPNENGLERHQKAESERYLSGVCSLDIIDDLSQDVLFRSLLLKTRSVFPSAHSAPIRSGPKSLLSQTDTLTDAEDRTAL